MKKVDREDILDFLDFIIQQKNAGNEKSYIAIKNAMELFSIPIPFHTIPKGTPFYRIRVHEENVDKYHYIQDIAHRVDINRICNFGRANEPLQSIFYCSSERETAYIESSRILRQKLDDQVEVTTTGKWRLNQDVRVAMLPTNDLNKNKNKFADLLQLNFIDLVEKYRNENTDHFLSVLDILSVEFSREYMGNSNNYMISCAFANYIYNSHGMNSETDEVIRLDGIMYPSVQWPTKGMNIAFKPEVIESGILTLEVAVKITTVRIDEKKYQDTESVKSSSIDYKDYKIIW